MSRYTAISLTLPAGLSQIRDIFTTAEVWLFLNKKLDSTGEIGIVFFSLSLKWLADEEIGFR